MSSPDVRTQDVEFDPTKAITVEDPFWPPIGISFPVSPAEMNDWATRIFNASEFLFLFDGDNK